MTKSFGCKILTPLNIIDCLQVALIFGINGAMRGCELVNLAMKHLTFHDRILQVDVPASRTETNRSFTIDEKFYDTVKKYMNMRPENIVSGRFFVNYQKGKCTSQFIGKHKFSKMPKEIALFLGLENSDMYTGHAFRRTAATLLAQSGASMVRLKDLGGWKSDSTAQSFCKDSVAFKRKTSSMISTNINLNVDNELPPSPKREKSCILDITSSSGVTADVDTTTSAGTQIFNFTNCSVNIIKK